MPVPEPHKIDLLTHYERLSCYRCREMRVSEDKRYVWCELNHKDFPIMCKEYRGLHGNQLSSSTQASIIPFLVGVKRCYCPILSWLN